jgi:hypothetical protein
MVHRRPERIDWAGIGLLIVAVGTLQFVLEEEEVWTGLKAVK